MGKKNYGFLLIEMMIALVMLALLAQLLATATGIIAKQYKRATNQAEACNLALKTIACIQANKPIPASDQFHIQCQKYKLSEDLPYTGYIVIVQGIHAKVSLEGGLLESYI